ncbi:MAG: hypothetical protein LBB09_02360 [Rickettsiales bacterium]|jgi:hypothetical protein|nr:hypothetical protein [Rickettsiales bacterium]
MDGAALVLAVFFSFGLRPFIYKPIAKKYPPAVAMLTDGIGSLILTLPFFFMSRVVFSWHPILLLSLAHGALLSYFVKYSQIILKESTSSQQYLLIVALGLVILINKLCGDKISNGQVITVIFVAMVALAFFLRIVRKLSKEAQAAWVIDLVILFLILSIPAIALRYSNWFSLFLFTSIANFATDIYEFIKCKNILKREKIKLSGDLLWAGLFQALGELIFMYANPALGVTSVLVIKRASAPFVMLINNFFLNKHEENNFDNVVFAILAGLLALLYFLTANQ